MTARPDPSLPTRLVFAIALMGSGFLLVSGHNLPGGGFVGGIVAGAAVTVRYVTGGLGAVRRLSGGQPWTVLGVGLLLALLTAVAPVLFGEPILQATFVDVDLPVFGEVKAGTVLLFDIGVYLVVVGVVLMMFESFGDEPEPDPGRLVTDRGGPT